MTSNRAISRNNSSIGSKNGGSDVVSNDSKGNSKRVSSGKIGSSHK